MPLTETILLGGGILIEGVCLACCFSRGTTRFVQKSFARQILTWLLIHGFLGFLLLAGGYFEKEHQMYSQLREPLDEYKASPPETIAIAGDPALMRLLTAQTPALPRPAATDRAVWQHWQATLRQQMQQVFDFTPTSSLVTAQRLASVSIGADVTRILLTLTAFDGTTIPAYLFLPAGKTAQPAVIVLHGHIGEYEEGISQTGGIVPSYHNSAALALAQAGFVTLALEFRGFGYLGRQVDTRYVLVAHNAILAGTFYKAILAQDIQAALNFLMTLPEVDPQRIGITGASLGGEMAITYAALDERIKAVVCHSYGGVTGVTPGETGQKTPQPFYTHTVPGQNMYMLREDWFLLAAPRPLLVLRGASDPDTPAEVDIAAFTAALQPAYALFQQASAFQIATLPGGHLFFVAPTVQFFRQNL